MSEHIGRFEVRGVLGRGATGVVHDAFDPTLGRSVAIKLLHADAEHVDAAASARLLREAQALARLGHPNVVTIHEVGHHGDDVFLVMERIEGLTARAWRETAPRSEAEILDVYRQVGGGLAAAHRAGLVHRDVKPDNVLVGNDGRARITDFGLAAAPDAPATEIDDDAPDDPTREHLTRTGARLGTPAYMAAEAHRGEALDARSDQFGFCVALWEALAGSLPFVGVTYRERARAVCGDRLEAGDAVPPRIREILRRGLSADPAQRWPSMEAVVEALAEPAPAPAVVVAAPTRRRAVVAIGSVAGLGVVIAAVAIGRDRSSSAAGARPDAAPAATAVVASTRPSAALLSDGTSCPFLPAFVSDTTVVYEDTRVAGNGKDLYKLTLGGQAELLLSRPIDTVRAARGRTAGEALFTSPDGAGAIDSATGRTEALPFRALGAGFGGGAIVYHRAVNSVIREIVDGEDRPLIEMPRHRFPFALGVSVDGRRLAVSVHPQLGALSMCLIDRNGTTPPPYTCTDDPEMVAARPAFSPDGDTLYYATVKGIHRRDLHPEGVDELWLPGVLAWGGIDVAPGGAALVFAGGLTDGEQLRGEIAAHDAPDLPLLRGYGAEPSGHPSGTWVYAPGGTVVIAVPGKPATRVTEPSLGQAIRPMLDVTGRRAVFDVDGPSPGIHVASLDGPPVQLTAGKTDDNPVWTADARVVFARVDPDGHPRLYLVDADGAGTATAALDGDLRPHDRVPATGEILIGDEATMELALWHPVTGARRALPAGEFTGQAFNQALISADSRWVIVTTNLALWKIPIPDAADTGAPRLATQLPRPAIGLCDFVDRAGMDRDGRVWIAIQRGRTDLFLVDLAAATP